MVSLNYQSANLTICINNVNYTLYNVCLTDMYHDVNGITLYYNFLSTNYDNIATLLLAGISHHVEGSCVYVVDMPYYMVKRISNL